MHGPFQFSQDPQDKIGKALIHSLASRFSFLHFPIFHKKGRRVPFKNYVQTLAQNSR